MGSVSLSLSPPASGSPPDLDQYIGTSISVGDQAKNNAANATSLVCPICNEEMVRESVMPFGAPGMAH